MLCQVGLVHTVGLLWGIRICGQWSGWLNIKWEHIVSGGPSVTDWHREVHNQS